MLVDCVIYPEHKMPLRDRKKTGYWMNRSRLELILMGVIFVAVLIAIVLLIFILIKPSQAEPVELSSDICHTPTCIQEATKIIQQIDSNIDPCDDFYGFACGNFIKASHGDEKLNIFYKMNAQRKRELWELYTEDIKDNEHKIVKSTKKLFKECMNESGIEDDTLNSIKVVLEEIGGWPALLKGSNWNESNFDWLQATYKLRELGYPFSIFLNVDIEEDKKNIGRYIFKVNVPDIYNSMLNKYSKEQAVTIMTEIAVLFGAEDRQFAFKQMDGTYRFWKYLETNKLYTDETKIKISDFQKNYGNSFNWLEFINNITGSFVPVSKDDYVLFQDARGLQIWLDLLKTTPKRTLANYMIWRVIEKQFPYLTRSIRNLDTKREQLTRYDVEYVFASADETRTEFCVKEIEKRFTFTPIEILYNRKYVPVLKRIRVEKILQNLKSELVNFLKNADWLEKKDKKTAVEKVEAITIIVGQPGNYFDDKILDVLDIDMVEPKTKTFLNLLAQFERNHQTLLYNRINKTTFENFMGRPRIKTAIDYSDYDEKDNVIFVPAIAIQGFSFEENRPNYLNYAAIGNGFSSLSSIFPYWFYFDTHVRASSWSNETTRHIEKMFQCLKENMTECKLTGPGVLLTEPFAFGLGIGETISYAAYEKWVKTNSEEKKLIGLQYTPRQLFWISTTYCYTTNIYSSTNEYFLDDPMFFQRITCSAKSNNLDFARDFNCPKGSRMNPDVKCII